MDAGLGETAIAPRKDARHRMAIAHYQRFDTPGISARDRFEYWRTWYSETIDVPMRLEPVTELPSDFEASAEVLPAGDVDIVDYRFGPAVGSWQQDAIAASERLRLVLLAPSPGGVGTWHGRDVPLGRGAVALLGRTPGYWNVPRGLRGIQVNVPRAAIALADVEIEALNDQRRLADDATWAWLVRPALAGMAGHLDELSGTDDSALRALWVSLLAMLVRSLLGRDLNGCDLAAARRMQARRYIRARLADPDLSPDAVADALHVSRRTLYAAFAATTQGVAAAIRHERLERAHAMLAEPGCRRTIAEIAAAVGFRHAAHFSRSFRAEYGVNPRDVRAGVVAAPTAARSAGRRRASRARPPSS